MAAGSSLLHCLFLQSAVSLLSLMDSFKLLLCLTLFSASTALQQDVQVKPGEDVTLQCQIPKNETISVLKWSRADLNTDGYVYFYRNRRSYENYQHPSFHGRVKLRNPEMKDRDVSLILENVTFNDAGMYECHVAVRNPGSSKRAHTEIIHFINLTVTGETPKDMLEKLIMEREDADGNTDDAEQAGTPTAPLVVVAAVTAVAVVAVLLALLLKRNKKQHLTELPTEEESGLKHPADGAEM